MLRKLFGFPPASRRRVRAVTIAPASRAPAAPHRRKPVFEALENRLLLSADPLGVFAPGGVLALQLGAGDGRALVERIGTARTTTRGWAPRWCCR